ncbi:hypothetical protein WA026_005871 [Henosepilachna vigintioctopunctata]|uniref:Uncharacterized protein n=1 Tax=Henosepilachna vigintioctopunctata TaxID=420089 RepID=A0AAW1U4I5_9CUCU
MNATLLDTQLSSFFDTMLSQFKQVILVKEIKMLIINRSFSDTSIDLVAFYTHILQFIFKYIHCFKGTLNENNTCGTIKYNQANHSTSFFENNSFKMSKNFQFITKEFPPGN